MRFAILLALVATVAACKQGLNERCQTGDDCESGKCSTSQMICVEDITSSDAATVADAPPVDAPTDGGTEDAATDASGSDAEPADAPPPDSLLPTDAP